MDSFRPLRGAAVAASLGVTLALSETAAQNATVAGDVVLREGGVPLGFITVSVLAQDKHLLTGESGTFLLREVPPGDVRLRFRRIGFAPKDTTLTLAAGDTARLRIGMTRLAIQLPEVLVRGRCTNETPFEPKPAFMAELLDQVTQNAQRMVLLAQAKPFVASWARVGEWREPGKAPVRIDSLTYTRGPLSHETYRPGRVVRPITINGRSAWGVFPPELPDFADTAFIHNHCFRYAGPTRFESDSVIAVEFEPVPRLANVPDMTGTLYLRVDGYQLAGQESHVTPLHRVQRDLSAYTHRTIFKEIVPGVPVASEFELVNVPRNGRRGYAERVRLVEIKWTEPVKTDTMRP